MRTRLHQLIVVTALTALGLGAMAITPLPASQGDGAPSAHERIYLHADTGDYLWWSLDPHEDTGDQQLLVRDCPSQAGLPGARPCLSGRDGVSRSHTLWFHPRSKVAQQLTWDPGTPLRFHLALEVETVFPDYDVHLVASTGPSGIQASEPATEVEPGVWEGELSSGALNVDGYPLFGIRIQFPTEGRATLRIGVDGASWLELPEPVEGWSLGDLWRQSPLSEEPQTYETPLRTLWFADDDWEVVTLEGDLSNAGTLTHTTDRPAAAVLGWVEAFGDPVVYSAVRDGAVHPERVTEAPALRLLHNGAEVNHGANPGTIAGGQGTDAVAATDLSAGDISLEVLPTEAGQQSPYTAHLLVVYGLRTLERMQVAFTPAHTVRQPAMRAVVLTSCPTNSDTVPLTSAATAVRLRLDWDSAGLDAKWAPRFTLEGANYPCSEAGVGPDVTLVPPTPTVFAFGATPARDAAFVSYRDTVILADVRILYAAADQG